MCRSKCQRLSLLPGTGWKSYLLLLLALVVNPFVYGQQTTKKGPAAKPTEAATDTLAVPKGLIVRGVPSLPEAAGERLVPYQIYGLPLARWARATPQIMLKGLSSVSWVELINAPGEKGQVLAPFYIQQPGIYDFYWMHKGPYLAYTQDRQGDEHFQLVLYDIGKQTSLPLAPANSRNTEPIWAHDNERLVYSSSPDGFEGVNLRVNKALPLTTNDNSDRLLVTARGGEYLQAHDWSPDDKSVVYVGYTAFGVSTLGSVNVGTGEITLLSPAKEPPAFYETPAYSSDGGGLYVITDREAETRRLAYLDLTTRTWSYLFNQPWDVEEFALSPDGKTIAFLVNENGLSRLHLWDITTRVEKTVPELPLGRIAGLQWSSAAPLLAFNVKSPQMANDVFSLDITTGQLTVWARSQTNGLDTSRLAIPQLIHWKSFDGLSIPGYISRPPATFSGKHPVIIDLHGGPEDQVRPGFFGTDNYYSNELGIAFIYPNVRGSTGYGKKFASLDNGALRENAVKDVGALLDWIATQPDLDASRVLVTGTSTGGYLSLAVGEAYSSRLRGVMAEFGPTNLASYVAHTAGWRRIYQRSEYGDERQPAVKAYLERISLVKNAAALKTPLFLVAGQNDPRIPITETEALVKALSPRVPLWYILGTDEGHGSGGTPIVHPPPPPSPIPTILIILIDLLT